MPVPRASQIHVGTQVSIILKQDQPTGRQVTGTVAELLTRGDHPRGVKVRLTDGRVGRVQGLQSQSHAGHGSSGVQQSGEYYGGRASDYPVAPGLPHRPQGERQQYEQQQYGQQQHGLQQYGQQQYGQHQQALYPQFNTPQEHYEADPNRATSTRIAAGDQTDTAAQVEHFQVYEQAKGASQQDRDQRTLEQAFPHVDGSLIAALYSDLEGDMSGCREMLQAIGSES